MGLANYLLNPLPLSIVFNSYIAFFLPLGIYFLLLKNASSTSRVPLYIKEMLFILLVGWLSSSWLAMYSTLNQCGSFHLWWTLLIGLITPAFMLLGFVLVRYLAPFLATPAKVLFGWIQHPYL